ncbi:hypothetical protein [Arthrobacter cryoconiti]|uniref:Uncharacterized protein n=1 Tax=Arthrobacter cryoconiti TaxID=748907 RepID=A0ABV8QY69_9MICC|nr:hypothetical protein [Arthrobacter cryoconiti]MCC9068848.1 hypothetical protein [Arthrobacter cryoconiti]
MPQTTFAQHPEPSNVSETTGLLQHMRNMLSEQFLHTEQDFNDVLTLLEMSLAHPVTTAAEYGTATPEQVAVFETEVR